MRNRGAGIILDAGRIALIKRVRDGETYYVFPGGGMERGETPEEAAIREVFEELGVTVTLKGSPIVSERVDGSKEYYYISEIVSGSFGTGSGEEYTLNQNRGSYMPIWVDLKEIKSLDVRPKEIAARLIEKVRS
ncbi:MAG TPA: NUDIX domain-containing protein [Bacillales bacterium]|nr:NUDIX domain-containing protein [Bacillales bacterium]